jgi:hypothetical protein
MPPLRRVEMHTKETMAQKKLDQITFWVMKLLPSSMENSVPPMGAPNAAATPENGETRRRIKKRDGSGSCSRTCSRAT